tara:strand:- start:276 stop:785 length:510 start_codon:yes stop_codon:yes gene_type:complete
MNQTTSETGKNIKMNINVLLQNVGASQISYYVIRNLNELGNTRPDIDAIVYYETMHRNCLPPNFAIMQIAEAWGQHGPVIATSLSTALKLTGFPSERKIFYVWDLEWLRGQQRHYKTYADIYTHPDLELIARSEDHKRAVENAFNREVKHVISDFDTNQLLKVLEGNDG